MTGKKTGVGWRVGASFQIDPRKTGTLHELFLNFLDETLHFLLIPVYILYPYIRFNGGKCVFDVRGKFGSVKTVNVGGITTTLKSKYKHMVLVLDTVDSKMDYEQLHAVDSLASMGWCRFDDIQDCLGKQMAMKVLKFCEKQIANQVKKKKK